MKVWNRIRQHVKCSDLFATAKQEAEEEVNVCSRDGEKEMASLIHINKTKKFCVSVLLISSLSVIRGSL